jgi:hypothetical protein
MHQLRLFSLCANTHVLDNENPFASATGGHFQGLNDSGGKTVKMMRKNRRGINPSMH